MTRSTADTIAQPRAAKRVRSGRRGCSTCSRSAAGCRRRELVARLAGTLGYRACDHGRSRRAATPRSTCCPTPNAAQRGCALLRGADGALLLAFGDPFAADLHAWAEERIAEPFDWRLAHRADLAAYLARHEEGLRAMDGVVDAAARREPGASRRVEDLSLKAISEDDERGRAAWCTPPCYDALKAGASDIHLETRAQRARHQVPHRRGALAGRRCSRAASRPSR